MISALFATLAHLLFGFVIGVGICTVIYYTKKDENKKGDISFLQGYAIAILPFTTILGLVIGTIGNMGWLVPLCVVGIIAPIAFVIYFLDNYGFEMPQSRKPVPYSQPGLFNTLGVSSSGSRQQSL
ncbi:hypothetical protein AKO1_015366 [Acrasis kona]|uniref:Uncharacterized protein n=1 Tax=Acrasis kona TaxID=1008807 RepID=A0AAW2ZFS3_9EUKA